MKAIIAIIIAGSLAFGCALPEEEVATTDTSWGGKPTDESESTDEELANEIESNELTEEELAKFGVAKFGN